MKYRNQPARCIDKDHALHDSKAEAHYCTYLAGLKSDGKIKDYFIQIPYELSVNGHCICKHIVDFIVVYKDRVQAHEVKGFKTRDWVIKRKLFEALHPEMEYVVITKGESCLKKRLSTKSLRRKLIFR